MAQFALALASALVIAGPLAAAPQARARPSPGKSGAAKAAVNKAATKPGPFVAFPYPVEQHTLKNGLRVAFVSFDSPGLVAFYTLVRVGSRNEPEKGRSGYAHFFEHMMFRGTKAHPAEEYAGTISRLGLSENAYTSDDMTVYHLYGSARSLPTVIEYEADRFANLDYSEQAFRTEAGAILGEYSTHASNPDLKLDEALQALAYNKHTYKHTTLGFLEDIQAMPDGYAYSREFFHRYYTPDDATIIVAGDFDRERALAEIEKAWGSWKGKAKPAAVPAEPPQTKAKRAHVDWPRPTLPRLWISWHVPAAGDLKAAAAETLLDEYLFGEASALHQDLILDRQLCESFEGNWGYQRDPGLFGFAAEVKKAADEAEVERTAIAAVREAAAGKIDRARLEGVRSRLKYSAALRLDTADKAANWLARMTAVNGDLNYGNKLYAQIDKISAAEVAAYAKRWLTPNNQTTVDLSFAGKGVEK